MTGTHDNTGRFTRASDDRMIAGVCAGFAAHLGVDVSIVRVLWAVSAFLGGLGLIAYLVAMLVVPSAEEAEVESTVPSDRPATEERGEGARRTRWGLGLIVAGVLLPFLFAGAFPHWLIWSVGWKLSLAVILVIAGLFVATAGIRGGRRPVGEGPLRRSVDERLVGGVCGGLSARYGLDPSIVRIAWILATFLSLGVGVIAYVVLVLVVPEEARAAAAGGDTSAAATGTDAPSGPPAVPSPRHSSSSGESAPGPAAST